MREDLFRKNLVSKLGEEGLQRIEGIRIGIAGAGGLGSNCAAHLVRVGFRKLTLVDFDVVTAANLDRQFFFQNQIGLKKTEALKINLLKIRPGLELKIIDAKITGANAKTIFSGCEIIVECLDRAESKSMLAQVLLPAGRLIVSVSGLGGIGASDQIQIHWMKKNLVIIGDLYSDIENAPALAPRVGIAAAKQADIVLEYALKNPTSKGQNDS